MPPLYYCPCIAFGATLFYLPPWITADFTRSQKVEVHTVPQTNQQLITSVRPNLGTKISLTASGVKPGQLSQASVLAWFEEIWSHLSGEDKTFDLFIFSDRAWSGCALETQNESVGLEPLIVLKDARLDIVCPNTSPDTSKQLTFGDYNSEYPYSSLVGRPLGDAVVPGTVTPIMQPSRQTLSGTFPWQQAATTAGQEHRFTVGGSDGSQWILESVQITWSDPGDATGDTTVRVSTAGVGGAGAALNATVAAGEVFSLETAGSISVTAGDPLFVFIPTAGGHQNIQYAFRLRAV